MKEVTFHLEVFDGPLDLLLQLLSKNKVDIRDIPIADILEQYLEYIRRMQEFDLEVASEFITMAAQLMYIKSKMLLPTHQEEEGEDPREALVEALLEYQRFKELSSVLDSMSEIGRDLFVKQAEILEKDPSRVPINGTVEELIRAVEVIFQRTEIRLPPPVSSFAGIVEREEVSIEDKLSSLVSMFKNHRVINLEKLFLSQKSRPELVALFLAVLELSKDRKIIIEDTDLGYTLRLAGPQDLLDDIIPEESDGDK